MSIFGVLALVGLAGLLFIAAVLIVVVTVQALRERDFVLLTIVAFGAIALVGIGGWAVAA